MNRLFILRAAPGTGKSTWVENNNLSRITVSSDAWRIKLVGLAPDENGVMRISQQKPWLVWKKVGEDITYRMDLGEDIILDSQGLYAKDIKKYVEQADEAGYDSYIVEFWQAVDRETAKKRNAGRDEYQVVPDFVIDNFYDKVGDEKIPEGAVSITPEVAEEMLAQKSGGRARARTKTMRSR